MRYLRHFFGAFAVLLGAVGAVNGAIDPYGVLGTPIVDGFNQVKSPAPDRFFKPLQASRRQPRTVLLGDSRVLRGLDPRDVAGGDAYNLGIPAATIAEEAALARHVLADTPARRLVFGLDYTSFNDAIVSYPSFKLAILGRDALWRALPDLLLSQRALVRSRNAYLLSRRHAPPPYQPDGLQLEPPAAVAPAERVLQQVREYVFLDGLVHRDDGALARFDRLLAELPAGVEAVAFVPPAHAALLEVMAQTGRRPAYEDWLRRLTLICAAHGVALWDFGGYNAVTTLPLAATGPLYFDGSHFRPTVGARVLATMQRGAAQDGFGTRLTPQTIEPYLADQRRARAAWLAALPADAEAISAAIRSIRR